MRVYAITNLRNAKVHMSGLMLMGIIHRLHIKGKSAYLAEIEIKYKEISEKPCYSYSGIYCQLAILVKKGYVHVEKHGRYNSYSLTSKGTEATSLTLGIKVDVDNSHLV